jgi:hypothetical protein
MDVSWLVLGAISVVPLLPAPIYCAAQRPRLPFFMGMVGGLAAGAIGGLVIMWGVLVLLLWGQNDGSLFAVFYGGLAIGGVGGGCLGEWIGIVRMGRAQANSRGLARKEKRRTAKMARRARKGTNLAGPQN